MLLLTILPCVIVLRAEKAWSHSEHGPYANFEAPGFWWTETPCFSEGLGRVKLEKGFGFIDSSGKVVLKYYKDAKGFSEGLAAVMNQEGRWGYIDKAGSLVIPYQFDGAENFSDGLARVQVKDRWGYLDKSGKLVIPALYDNNSSNFSGGRAYTRTTIVTDSGRFEFMHAMIDKNGQIINTDFFTRSFSEGLAYAWSLTGEGALINREGRTIALEQTYDWVREFSEGVAAVGFNGQGGFIDKTGKLVLKLGQVLADSFHEGLAPALKGKRWGYIDRQGKFIIGPQFDMAQEFSEGLAAVSLRGKWGYIDRFGKMRIPPKLHIPGKFADGLACVQIDESTELYAYIDKSGKIVWKGPFF